LGTKKVNIHWKSGKTGKVGEQEKGMQKPPGADTGAQNTTVRRGLETGGGRRAKMSPTSRERWRGISR